MTITEQLEQARKHLPEGYVIVPIEPTKEMLKSAAMYVEYPDTTDQELIYKAMINEAQK